MNSLPCQAARLCAISRACWRWLAELRCSFHPSPASGAILLLAVDVGAFFAQIFFLHEDWIYPIVIGAILVALIYLQRDAVRQRLLM